jgi:basic membrane protein A
MIRAGGVCAVAAALTLGAAAQAADGKAGGPFKVVYVMNDQLGDHGFNDSANRGFEKLKAEGIETKMLQASPSDPQLWLQNLQAVADDGTWDVIFCGPGMHDNLAAVAAKHPNQKFVMFDDNLPLPNVMSMQYGQNEGSFLAGLLAGIVTTDTKSFPLSAGAKKVGVIGGADIPVIRDFLGGYEQGVKTIDPSIEVKIAFIGNFNDAQKAYDLTQGMYESGADVVYDVAGPAGLGILKAGADAGKYAIGVDSDQTGLYPAAVLASMIKEIGNSLYDAAKLIKEGKGKFNELTIYAMHNNGVGLVYNKTLIPEAVKTRIDGVKAKVVAGDIKVVSYYKH